MAARSRNPGNLLQDRRIVVALQVCAVGVVVVLWNERLDLITEHENPVMATNQLLLGFPLGGYSVWALSRDWALRLHHPPEGGP